MDVIAALLPPVVVGAAFVAIIFAVKKLVDSDEDHREAE